MFYQRQVSESSCQSLPGHWGWKRRPFYMFFTPQRFDTAKTQCRLRRRGHAAAQHHLEPPLRDHLII